MIIELYYPLQIRPPRDVGVLNVLDFKNPCSRPGAHLRRCLPSIRVRTKIWTPDDYAKGGNEILVTRVSKVQEGEDFLRSAGCGALHHIFKIHYLYMFYILLKILYKI